MSSGEIEIKHAVETSGVVSAVRRFLDGVGERREALGLTYPGTIENIHKEVQRDVFVTNHMFTGLRADLAKTFSMAPLFQVAHAFTQGTQTLPPYTFLATFGTPKVYLQGHTDNEGTIAARANYRWSDWWITKTQTQIAPSNGQAMMQIDQELSGRDFSASLKTINPSLLDGGVTGVFVGSYLQSVTPGLALGLEAMWSRASMQMGPESTVAYVAKYKGSGWIASAQLAGVGSVNASYWRRLTDKVEVGSDLALQIQPSGAGRGLTGGLQKQGSATLGAKYSFRTSVFRAQVDSSGKLSALLERAVFPTVQVSFAGEIDHLKQSAKVGVGVSVEIQNEDVALQQERLMQAGEAAVPLPPM